VVVEGVEDGDVDGAAVDADEEDDVPLAVENDALAKADVANAVDLNAEDEFDDAGEKADKLHEELDNDDVAVYLEVGWTELRIVDAEDLLMELDILRDPAVCTVSADMPLNSEEHPCRC
jgi:hypothetical protein